MVLARKDRALTAAARGTSTLPFRTHLELREDEGDGGGAAGGGGGQVHQAGAAEQVHHFTSDARCHIEGRHLVGTEPRFGGGAHARVHTVKREGAWISVPLSV